MGDDRTLPWRDPRLTLALLVAMMAPLDVGILGPALPRIAETFDVSGARAGLVITAYALPGAVLAPVVGTLADRHGRVRVLVPGLAVFGVAGVAVTFVSPGAPWAFETVLALRVVQGCVGGSIFASLAMALLGDYYGGSRRNAAMGAATAALSVTAAAGPAIGGALAARAWDAPFYLYGVSAVVAVVVAVGVEEPDRDVTVDHASMRSTVTSLPLRALAATFLAAFVAYALYFGGAISAVPFFLEATFGLASGRIGALVTLASLVGAVVALFNGRFARHLSNSALVACGFVAYGVGLLVVGLSPSTLAVAAGLVVFGVGHGLVQPAVAAALSAVGSDDVRGLVLSLRTSIVLASQAAGPPVLVGVGTALGYDDVFVAVGALTALAGAVALSLRRRE